MRFRAYEADRMVMDVHAGGRGLLGAERGVLPRVARQGERKSGANVQG